MNEDPTPEQIKEVTQSEWAAFRMLWTYMDKRSYLSNLFLRDFYSGPYFLNCFAHVLAKGKNQHPYFKYYLRNIILLTPGEHALLDQGTVEQRESYATKVKTADWTKIGVLKESLLQEYNAVFPKKQGLIIGIKYSGDEVRDVIRKLNALFLTELLGPPQPVKKHNNKKSKGDGAPHKP